MVRTPYWILERDVGQAYFRLRRTAKPVESLDELRKQTDMLERARHGIDTSRLGLLLDLRDGPMRNDPEFERVARPYQERLFTGFARVAVLVKTPVGKLQTARIVRGFEGARVFDDERAAVEYLTARE